MDEMTDRETEILGYLNSGTPDDTIRSNMDASQAEIVIVRNKCTVAVSNAEPETEPEEVERPDAIQEIDEKVKPKIVKQGPPRDENAERAKLAKIQGASAEPDAGKKKEDAGELDNDQGDSAPAADTAQATINPENVLDQNAKTVIKKIREEEYSKDNLAALTNHEEKTRKRSSIIKFIDKMIKKYMDE